MSEGFARLYDPLMAPLERFWLGRWRDQLIASLTGDVLEVGAGTGINFEHYPPGLAVTALEPDSAMRRRAEARALELGRSIPVLDMRVEALQFEAERFDTVFATLVFCNVDDPLASLREIYRVLKPGGRLVLLEHTLSAHAALNVLLRALTAVTGPLLGEHFDRDPAAAVREVGFEHVAIRGLGWQVFHALEARRPLRDPAAGC